MKVNKEKLERIILQEIKDIKYSIWTASELVIYNSDNMQVTVKVNCDSDDFIDLDEYADISIDD